ncbi:MAG: AlpA family phage regulatory protein [Actinomycetia bacterium]|nr:AlpA family phage regulatory protein [Actinomycetes bacterium]
MADQLLNRKQVEERVGLARSTVYRRMRQGSFPLSIRVSQRAVRWSKSEVEAWVSSRERVTGDKPDA